MRSIWKSERVALRSRVALGVVFVFMSAAAGRAQESPPQTQAQQASAPQTAAQPTPAPVTTPKPPFPNRANDSMPAWLRIRGEVRERIEGFQGSGFVEGRDDGYFLTRFRFNVAAT